MHRLLHGPAPRASNGAVCPAAPPRARAGLPWEAVFADDRLGGIFNKGWVGEIPWAPGVSGQQQKQTKSAPPPQPSEHAEQPQPRRASALVERGSFGARLAPVAAPAAAVRAAEEASGAVPAPADEAGRDEFSVSAWAADDPLDALEVDLRDSEAPRPT